MINQGVDVPENTISVFDSFSDNGFNKKNNLHTVLEKPSKTREWFGKNLYKISPIDIGNQQGFIIKAEYDFAFHWDGGELADSVHIDIIKAKEKNIKKNFLTIQSRLGNGIISITPSFSLKTPPGVNLMTTNPPNYVIPNVTVMTKIIETDSVSKNFDFDLKIQMENISVTIFAGTPIAAFVPIPKHYGDNFDLKLAEDIFDQEN